MKIWVDKSKWWPLSRVSPGFHAIHDRLMFINWIWKEEMNCNDEVRSQKGNFKLPSKVPCVPRVIRHNVMPFICTHRKTVCKLCASRARTCQFVLENVKTKRNENVSLCSFFNLFDQIDINWNRLLIFFNCYKSIDYFFLIKKSLIITINNGYKYVQQLNKSELSSSSASVPFSVEHLSKFLISTPFGKPIIDSHLGL